jgi:hypothetical protein
VARRGSRRWVKKQHTRWCRGIRIMVNHTIRGSHTRWEIEAGFMLAAEPMVPVDATRGGGRDG